ncbi:type II secretion system protein GspG [Thalassotalea litorea]|uniref:type II secretion system protein GspG n=1 Tax=Thalassotalea litorea TaxID=2020715 RepID=UPI003734D3F0
MQNRIVIFVSILLVIAFLYVLVTPKIPTSMSSDIEADKRVISFVYEALNMFEKDTGDYPTSLDYLYVRRKGDDLWKGPYLANKINTNDSRGREWIYKYPHSCAINSGRPAFYSVGPNGIDECMGGDDIFFDFK